jgi:hypothetical protein
MSAEQRQSSEKVLIVTLRKHNKSPAVYLVEKQAFDAIVGTSDYNQRNKYSSELKQLCKQSPKLTDDTIKNVTIITESHDVFTAYELE